MFGPVLPIDLVTTSRRSRYFVLRVAYGLILLLLLWIDYGLILEPRNRSNGGTISSSELADFARVFFEGFCVVQLVAVLVLTPTMVAGTIAEERERRTLDFLLASDLGNAEIVLGKLVARLLHLVRQLLVGIPILSLTMILGGVGPAEIVAVMVVTASTMVLLAAASVWSSVWSRRAREAVTKVFLLSGVAFLPGLLSVFPIIPWSAFPWSGYFDWLIDPINASNPLLCLLDIMAGRAWPAAGVLVRNHALVSLVCMSAAVLQLRRAAQREAAASSGRLRWRLWRPLLGDSPMIWKELFVEASSRGLGWLARIVQLLIAVGILGGATYFFIQTRDGSRVSRESLHVFVAVTGTAIGCLTLLVVSLHAAVSCVSEREKQTWDSLLTSRLDAQQIVSAKLAGSLYAGRGLMLILVLLWTLGVAAGSIRPWTIPVALGEYAVLGSAAALLGLFYSLRCKTSLRAMAATAVTGAIAAGGYIFLTIPIVDQMAEIVLVSCVPFLLAFPMVVGGSDYTFGSQDHELAATCIFGNVGYFVAAIVLYSMAVNAFDVLAGRMSGDPISLPLPPNPRRGPTHHVPEATPAEPS